MFARYTTATGALIADNLAQEPQPVEGVTILEMPPSAVAGLTVWSAAAKGYVDPAPPMPFRDALLALLVSKGVITQAEANGLPK